jgi:branched-chain amino acid transport system permease protein
MQYLINGLPMGAIYALIALGYSLIYTTSGVLNWSQGDMIMLGAYVGFTVMEFLNFGFVPAFFIAMIVVGGIGYLVQRFILKPLRRRKAPATNVTIGTLGIAIIARNVSLFIWGPNAQSIKSPAGNKMFTVGPLNITGQDIVVIVVAVTLMLLLHFFLKKSKEGKAVRAVVSDRYAAQIFGISTARSDGIAFFTSAAMGAAAGMLIAPIFFVTFNMGATLGLKGFSAAVIGGLGSIPAAIFGGLFIGIVESLTSGVISSGYRDVLTYTILIIVLWLRPSGLFQRRKTQKV